MQNYERVVVEESQAAPRNLRNTKDFVILFLVVVVTGLVSFHLGTRVNERYHNDQTAQTLQHLQRRVDTLTEKLLSTPSPSITPSTTATSTTTPSTTSTTSASTTSTASSSISISTSTTTSPSTSEPPPNYRYSNCKADVVIALSGELRHGPSAWKKIHETLVAPNHADVVFAFWNGPSILRAIDFFRPCAVYFEDFGEAAKARMMELSPGIQRFGNDLYLFSERETRNNVYMFYMIWRASELIRGIENERGRRYTAVVRARSDIIYNVPEIIVVPPPKGVMFSRNVWDQTPEQREDYGTGCGKMPHDVFAYGDSESMEIYGFAFKRLKEIADRMKADPGFCEWYKPPCENANRPLGMFLNNAESFVGWNLRISNVVCYIDDKLFFERAT